MSEKETDDPDDNDTGELYDADPECDHEIVTLWSGIKCRKCPGWFCY